MLEFHCRKPTLIDEKWRKNVSFCTLVGFSGTRVAQVQYPMVRTLAPVKLFWHGTL